MLPIARVARAVAATMFGMTVGANIKRLRVMTGLSQEELSDRVGLTQGYISAAERSADVPLPDTIRQFAKALKVPPAELLRGVLTPYDALRGSTAPADAAPEPVRHDQRTTRLLALWSQADEKTRGLILEVVARLTASPGRS